MYAPETVTPSYIIFARYPEEGCVKTRLIPLIGTQGATALYQAMLLDIAGRIAQRGYHVTLCVTPPERVQSFRELLPFSDISIVAQRGTTLGDRMLNAFLDAHSRNLLPAIMIGTDSPTLPDAVFDAAEQALASGSRAVLGPACDGGFYLIGLADVISGCFFGSDYSNDTVFARTQQALQQHGAAPVVLQEWYDIDEEDGLTRLMAETTLRETAPRTAIVVEQLTKA